MAYNRAEQVLGALVHAYYEERNIEEVLSCVTDDIEWIGTENNDSASGKDDLRRLLEADVKAFPGSFQVELAPPVEQRIGGEAVLFVVTGKQVAVPGKICGFSIRGTACAVLTKQGWLIRQVHTSVPNTEMEKYSLEKELDEKRKQEHTLMAGIPGGVAIYRMKKDGRVITEYASEGLVRMCGFDTVSEYCDYVNRDCMLNVVKEDVPLVKEAVRKSTESRDPISIMYRIHVKGRDDLLQRLDANVMDMELGEDDLVVWYAVHTIVSDESKEIIRNQKELHKLIDEVPTGIGIYEIDGDQVIQNYMNNAFYTMMGETRESRSAYVGHNTLMAAHPDDIPTIREAVDKLLKGENHIEITYRIRKEGDKWLWIHMVAAAVERHDRHVTIYAAVSSYNDIMRTRQELEDNRNTLRIALQTANVFSWRYDYRQGRITDTGTLGEAFHLPKVLDNLPQSIIDMGFVSEDSEADFQRLYEKTAEEKQAMADVKSNVIGEKGIRWFKQIYTPVFDKNGNYTESIGIAIDISEQKHREQAYEDQIRLNKIATQDAISRVCMNLTKNTITAFDSEHPRYLEHRKYETASQLLESISENIKDDEERKKFEVVSTTENMIKAYQKGKSHIEITYHTNHGINWMHVTYDMMENPYNGDLEVISAIHDVTESERAKLVVNQLMAVDYESIALIDLKTGRLVPFRDNASNDNLHELMVLQEKVNGGETGLKLFLDKYAVPGTAEQAMEDNSIETISRKLQQSQSYECTYSLLIDGQRKHYRIFYSHVENDSRVLLCAIQNITDIYEREEKQRIQLAQALTQAQAASRAKTAFLSRVSHDMRTPLNGILGLAALMKDFAISPKVIQDLSQLELSGWYLLNLINDTLDVSRIESGNMSLHPTVCDSRNVLNNVVHLIKPSMDAKGITFTVQAEDLPMCLIYIDEGRLQQVAMNILGNAAKFTPEGGRVELIAKNLSVENNIITDEFLIRDNGIGMSKEYLPHIFESFSQEDDTTTNIHKGTGLGMAITYKIVKLMGGSMEVTSKKGEGTCVKVTIKFPMATQEQIGQCKRSKQPHAASYNLANRRVLLCEDHPLNTQIATRLLEKVGIKVEHAENGKIGVEMFNKSAQGYYDAILMDIRMPVMDGLGAAREIRSLQRPDAHTIPILAMTANAFDEDVRRSHEAGMDAHLSKPINPEVLYRSLEQFINPNNAFSKQRILVVDDVEVNRAVIAASLQDRYEVFEADSGIRALALMKEHNGMDAVITDIQMPEMDGAELIRRIRAEEAYRHTVIIANTQYEQPGQEEYLLSIGANDFIYKPTNPKIMEIRVENALRSL